MEKRRVRLNINGVVCGIITEESDEYMQDVSNSVGEMMAKIMASSPVITRESAALTVALSFCDDAKRSEERLEKIKDKSAEIERRALEADRLATALKKENKQLWEETEALLNQPKGEMSSEERLSMQKKIEELETEIVALRGKIKEPELETTPAPKLKNPLKQDDVDQQGFVSFFKRDDDED